MNTAVALGFRFGLDIAVKATVLFAVTGAVLYALRRAPAAARHLVGTVALAAALALPLSRSCCRAWLCRSCRTCRSSSHRESARRRLPPSTRRPRPSASPHRSVQAAAALETETVSRPTSAGSATPAPSPTRPSMPRIPWLALALAAWGAGAMLVGARLAVGWARVRRIAREAEPIQEADWYAERDALPCA